MADSDKQRIYDDSKNDSNNQIPLVLSIIALLLAVIGVIIGAVSLSQKGTNNYVINGGSSSDNSSPQTVDGRLSNYRDDKIWVMSIGHDANRWEYLDEVTGQIKGFDVDIVNAVCTIAGKNCRLSADIYQRCWDSVVGQAQRGGEGLYGGYYDACTAWSHGYARARTFQFTSSFTKPKIAAFVVKPGNPRNFNWRDLTGKKIGFIDGYVFDEYCVARQGDSVQGSTLSPDQIVHYSSRDDLVEGVRNEEVDAGFTNKDTYEDGDVLDVVSSGITNCVKDGYAMMTRKDSRMWEWWNPALERLLATSEYRTICKDLLDQHGHVSGPDPEDLCIGH